VLQIATGIFLAMHYTAHVDLAFHSVQHIMRDVSNGWLLRYLHANGASLFFIVVYMHLFRGLYYTSYAQPRELVWLLGVVILLVMILTAFIGYVLPWGQMSLWGEFLLPQMDETFSEIYAFYVIGKKPKSFQRVGPHNLPVLSVMVGCLLGDAYAEYRRGSTRICFQQKNTHASYLYWLHNFFSKHGYCNTEKPKLQSRIGQNGRKRFVLRFRTWSFQSLNWLHEAFYQKGVKQVPVQFLPIFLNEQALAVWIMDDGTRSDHGLKIVTNCFRYDDLLKVQIFIKEKYDLIVSIHKSGTESQFSLYFPVKTIPTLAKLVKPYFVENIKYKLEKFGSSTREDLP
jgi:ubiquinol-cytochrome c reductase cytochrome b subunit